MEQARAIKRRHPPQKTTIFDGWQTTSLEVRRTPATNGLQKRSTKIDQIDTKNGHSQQPTRVGNPCRVTVRHSQGHTRSSFTLAEFMYSHLPKQQPDDSRSTITHSQISYQSISLSTSVHFCKRGCSQAAKHGRFVTSHIAFGASRHLSGSSITSCYPWRFR